MTASLERVVSTLRLHTDRSPLTAEERASTQVVRPYEGSATVITRGDTAEIVGLSITGGHFTKAHWVSVCTVLAEAGYSWLVFDRKVTTEARRTDARSARIDLSPYRAKAKTNAE